MPELDDEWTSAIEEEYGDEPDTSTEEVEAPEEEETPESPEVPEEESTEEPEEPEESEEPEEAEEPEAPEEPLKKEPTDEEVETPSTREEIKAALMELEKERATRDSGLNAMQEEVLNTLYPEGVDRQLRDADGDPIKGIEDLTGVDPQTGASVGNGLINPNTGDVFTEEEAARYILRGQQRLNEQVQLMEDQAYKIAETQLSLKESSDRVEAEFGDVLNSLPPETVKQITDAYIRTLRRDPNTGMVVDVPLDAYEFYSIALAGAKPLAAAPPTAPTPPAPAPAEAPAAPRDKSDRADLGQRGTPDKLSKEDAEWEQAFDEILN